MTGRFNLLPHRAQLKLWHRRVLLRQLSVVALLAIISALLVNSLFEMKVSHITAYNATLRSDTDVLVPAFQTSQQVMKQRDDMLEKQKILEMLDARRSTSVMILGDVARALSRDIYLTRLEEDGERFRLEGRSVNNAAIARFFESIVVSERLAAMSLEEIRMQEGEHAAPYTFAINGQVLLIGVGAHQAAGPQP